MAKRKLDEEYMKKLLANGLPYKPEIESSVSEEERKKALIEIEGEAALEKKPIPKPPQEPFVQEEAPIQEAEPEEAPKAEKKKYTPRKAKSKPEIKGIARGAMTIEEFVDFYLQPSISKSKMSFSVDRELLQLLRRILWDTGNSHISLASYVNNILSEHITLHRDLINKATADNIRKTTLP